MKRRKRGTNIHKKRKYLLIGLLVVFVFLGCGYSLLNADLNILGNITIKEYIAPTLYNVLKQEAETNGLALEYTGTHDDSFTETGTEKIYHWYASNATQGNQVLEKNNVIFGGFCWQMIRTTDTGGVKLMYNGEAENDQCLATRGTHLGYDIPFPLTETMSSSYYYGTDYEYDEDSGLFTLSGTITTGQIKEKQYTCMQTTQNATCSELRYVKKQDPEYPSTYYTFIMNGNANYSNIGNVDYNDSSKSIGNIGYMYKGRYNVQDGATTDHGVVLSALSLSTNYWYADSVTYTSGQYSLDNPYKVSSTSDYANLVGKYTFRKTSQTYTSYSVYYIVAVTGSSMIYVSLESENPPSYYNEEILLGDGYVDNGNDTYTFQGYSIIHLFDWNTDYETYVNKYICLNFTNNICNESPSYITSTGKNQYKQLYVSDKHKYSSGFTYENGSYKLNNQGSITFWNYADETNQAALNNAHYTCLNESGECSTLLFLNSFTKSDLSYSYIELTNEESVEDAIQNMLLSNDVNSNDSDIKMAIDMWYEKYFSEYSTYLEDTIFCNEREVTSFGGWSTTGDLTNYTLQFKNDTLSNDLSCSSDLNQFSTNNPKARLTYPVALISASELNLMNNQNTRKAGASYYTMTPKKFTTNSASIINVTSIGSYGTNNLITKLGVRPVISLKPGTEYTEGDGTTTTPYKVKMNT